MGENTQMEWDVVFDLFPQYNKIVKQIYRNKNSVFKPNEEEK